MINKMILSSVALVMILATARAAEEYPMAFTVSPEMVIENMTKELSIDCRTTDAIKDLKQVIMMAILVEDDDGLSMLASKWSSLEVREDDRTSAKGEFSDSASEPSYLSVTIKNPTFMDEGVYSCYLIYATPVFEPIRYESSFNLTVKDPDGAPLHFSTDYYSVHTSNHCTNRGRVTCRFNRIHDHENPPPNYVPPKTSSPSGGGNCDCGEIQEMVNSLKGSCQVSFSANLENQQGQPILSDHHLLFDHVISNKGEAYSTETGLFTAPCDGQYYFSLSLRSRQEMDSGYVDGVIMVDDQEVARTSAFIDQPLNHIETGTNSVVVSLKQGQEVKVVMKTTSFGQIMGSTYSVFTGFYLFP